MTTLPKGQFLFRGSEIFVAEVVVLSPSGQYALIDYGIDWREVAFAPRLRAWVDVDTIDVLEELPLRITVDA